MRVVACLFAVLMVVSGCARESSSATSVVVGLAPLAEVVTRVGGAYVDVTDVTPPGAEPHEVEPSPADVDALLDAQLVVLIGGRFQPAVEKLARTRRSGSTLLLMRDLRLEGSDPHIWLDPVVMTSIVTTVARALSRVDAQHAALYRANAVSYVGELESLRGRFEQALANCERRTIVTSHEAFGRLASRFGLTQRSIAGVSPESEPDARTVAEITDLVRSERITTIFTEELVSPRIAETIARETGARTAVLDPIETLSRGSTYTEAMDRNLAALRGALGCR